MGTNCKLVFGYTDHMGNWNVEREYYRHYHNEEYILFSRKIVKATSIIFFSKTQLQAVRETTDYRIVEKTLN